MASRTEEVGEANAPRVVRTHTTREVTQATSGDRNEPAAAAGYAITTMAERVIYYAIGVLTTLLTFRFVLSLLGANRGNGFADFIYSFSYPFVKPFFGLFGYNMQYGVSRFEIETLVAVAVYALLGYGLARLVAILGNTE